MAVVLPIQSQFDFSNPMDSDYGESRCQNEETEENENESSSGMFTNRDGDSNSNSPNSDSDCSRLPDSNEDEEQPDKDDDDDETNDSMDIGDCDSSDGNCDEKSETLPLNATVQSETERVDDSTATNEDGQNKEEDDQTSKTFLENYWMTENENHESKSPEEENNAFVSSLMAVDLATSNHETNEKSIVDPVSRAVDEILMDESVEKNEDGMELDATPTARATLMTDSNNDPEQADDNDGDARNVEIEFSSAPTMAEALPEVETLEAPPYGGLNNLGNTCYMASAIQLLCGLDTFPVDLKNRIPPENHNNNNNDNGDDDHKVSLRDALLDVMERLGKGETVRPDDLKRSIDSRTSLFLGYRQQDSHEFLTTLLDIIDEDYKIKPKPEQPEDHSTNEEDVTGDVTEDEEEEDENDLASDTKNEPPPASDEKEIIEKVCNVDENDCVCDKENDNDNAKDTSDRMPLETPLKKQKVVDDEKLVQADEEEGLAPETIESAGNATDTKSMEKSKSYSDFKFSDIESLLHDKGENSAEAATGTDSVTPAISAPRQDEPRCKLAGGRMSTTGVELTRFVDDSGLDEDVRPTGISLENATPQQQIVEGNDHEMMEEEGVAEETSLSPVSSNFTTKVRVCLTCESCKFRRSHTETYLHLSLDISTGSNESEDEVCNLGCPSSSSIEEGLRRFFAPEKREIKCEKCFHTTALQTSEITQLPRNLLFHLKRFIVDVSPDYSSISYRKDQSSVIFDERMELESSDEPETEQHALFHRTHDDEEQGFKDFLAQDCVYEQGAAYEIRSVVNHIGSSASCGHYTADAKRLFPDNEVETEESSAGQQQEEPIAENREWIRFNDSYVSRITSKEAVRDASKTAYMIMYELV